MDLRLVIICLTCVWAVGQAQHDLRLPNFYQSDMVLQSAPKSVQIWGWGGVLNTITIELNGEEFSKTTTLTDPIWTISLPPQEPGGPHNITVTLENSSSGHVETVELNNVMFGDVWLCAGEAPMVLPMNKVKDSEAEIEKAMMYKQIRVLKVQPQTSAVFEHDISVTTPWSPTSYESVKDFSSLCLMYGERLADSLGDRPIGLIQASFNGMPIETWAPPQVLKTCKTPADPRNMNSGLWNGTMVPLVALTLRGAIWAQGESNVGFNPTLYACHLKNMIKEWRAGFNEATVPVPNENNWAFPIGIVQIGPANTTANETWGIMRWHQTLDHGFYPNQDQNEVFLASSFDLTERDAPSISQYHDKATVATRLGNAAKHFLYNETQLPYIGPIAAEVKHQGGGNITVFFSTQIRSKVSGGFTYRAATTGEWLEAKVISAEGYGLTLMTAATVKQVSYGWSGTSCEYKDCAVYSLDHDMPGQTWIWNV